SRLVRKLADGNYLVDGTASLRSLKRQMGWTLPTAEAHTLSGLLIEVLEVIPVGQASVRIGNHAMTVVDIRDNTIRKVLIKPDRFPA
ncbi:MAG: magnesium/cobalt efflux protein, partial [Xanthomonadales bacterium]|nr:magnesium/cobalt efflux protein [Xanthomonadales bacterium]